MAMTATERAFFQWLIARTLLRLERERFAAKQEQAA